MIIYIIIIYFLNNFNHLVYLFFFIKSFQNKFPSMFKTITEIMMPESLTNRRVPMLYTRKAMQAFCVCLAFASMFNDKDFVIKEPKRNQQNIHFFGLAKNINATKQYVQMTLIFNNVLLRFVHKYVVLYFPPLSNVLKLKW